MLLSSKKLLEKYVDVPVELHKIVIQDKEISYLKAGQGPAVLLLHGANIGWIQWYPNLGHLARNYTVYAISLPGAGDSQELNYYEADFQADYVELIRKFTEKVIDRPYALIAHSFSGWIAVRLSENDQFAHKTILVNPLGFTRRIRAGHYPLSQKWSAKILARTVMKPNHKNMMSFFADVFHKQTIDPMLVDAYCDMISMQKHPFLFIGSLLQNFRLKKDLLLQRRDYHSSFFVIYSEYDPFMREVDYHKAIDFLKADGVIIPNSGHVPSIEDHELFNQIVSDFLDS